MDGDEMHVVGLPHCSDVIYSRREKCSPFMAAGIYYLERMVLYAVCAQLWIVPST